MGKERGKGFGWDWVWSGAQNTQRETRLYQPSKHWVCKGVPGHGKRGVDMQYARFVILYIDRTSTDVSHTQL